MDKANKKDVGAIFHHKGTATFRVWAPFAVSVAVMGSFNDWAHAPMASEGDGYWSVEIKKAESGQEYKFIINAGKQELIRNDPRSLQLTTSAGNSVLVDTTFGWEDDNFVAPPTNEQVVYELHIGTFNRTDPSMAGTFQSAMEKLDYLTDLGVNMLEIMPISSMSMDRGWGYATEYIYAIESLYGGRLEFLEFVKAAHKRGIGVILDVVYNHLGPSASMDLWQFDGWSQNGKGGIYFYNDWRAETPWGETRPDFGRKEVRQYILDNVRMWVNDCRLDGLRLDSTIYLRNVKGRNNDPEHDIAEGWSLMQQINSVAKKIRPTALIVAEDVGCNEYLTKPESEGGAGFLTQWEVDFPHVLRSALSTVEDKDRNLTGICSALTRRYNNDSFQRVVYSDSHDSAANGGSRLNEEISPGNGTNLFARRRSLVASAIVLTTPGIPMLFQGQEFVEDGSFNDWQALDWGKAGQFSDMVLAHKHIVALRKNQYGNTRGLTGQSVTILHLNEESKLIAYHRWEMGGPGDDVVVIINFANLLQEDYYINFPRKGTWRVRFSSDWKGYSPDFKDVVTPDVIVEGASGKFNIAPYSVLILSQDD
jgi:1,4-alpha-glucan branching enzyme